MRLPAFLVVLFGLSSASVLARPTNDSTSTLTGRAPAGWLYFDASLWDISNEGLFFRQTLALPSRRDPLTRLLFATEARWTFGVGYAKVYNSYDAATGVFKNPGGHAALFSAGRQFRWHLHERAFVPKLAIEFGGNFATRPFPADGTRGSLKVITGLEWTWRSRDQRAEWSAGVMWSHFSNANLFSRNAGYDGLALRFGRSILF